MPTENGFMLSSYRNFLARKPTTTTFEDVDSKTYVAPQSTMIPRPVKKPYEVPNTHTAGLDKMTITDPYAIRRNFYGRKDAHSTGIDYTTASGYAVNVDDGVIMAVGLQGSGLAVTPNNKPAAGYYVIIKHDNGLYSMQMHLDKDIYEKKDELVGKRLRKGERIWTYRRLNGSGTMSRPHTKLRIYTNFNDSKNSHVNPLPFLEGLI
jgi:murein DD-endopeptidase MepM/ murein hydrolase activator NlpD